VKVNSVILISNLSDESAIAIAVKLAEMGGRLTGWRPAKYDAPAKAYFRFENEQERERFAAGALDVPGVSIAAA
jgi:hypothetical protein